MFNMPFRTSLLLLIWIAELQPVWTAADRGCPNSVHLNSEKRSFMHNIHRSLAISRNASGIPLTTSDHIKLFNLFNKQYSGTVMLGQPSQAIDKVVFDTGSNDLWVFSETSGRYVSGVETFQEQLSTTFTETTKKFVVQYVMGFAQGMVGEDELVIGNQVVASKQMFGLVQIFSDCLNTDKELCVADSSSCKWDAWQNTCMDLKYPVPQQSNGILGLGYLKARSISGMPVVFDGSPLERFSFYMTGSSASGSIMIMGEPDPTLFKEPWIHCPLKTPSPLSSGWTVEIEKIRVGNDELVITENLYATVDTGTSVIGVDGSLWGAYLLGAIVTGARKCATAKDGSDTLVCEGKLPDVAFQVRADDGSLQELVLTNADYNPQYVEFLPIDGLSSQGVHFLLGDTFMRKYYTEFNHKDRLLSFAIRVKKKGNIIFWIVLLAVIVGGLALIACIVTYIRSRSRAASSLQGGQSVRYYQAEASRPEARDIVYEGQGTSTQYGSGRSNVVRPEQPSVVSSIPGVGRRLGDSRSSLTSAFGRLRPRQTSNAQRLREQREKLLSNLEQKQAS